MATDVTQEMLKSTFDYLPDTGRFVRVRPGLGAQVGRVVGHLTSDGFIRFHFAGSSRSNAHMVWVWNHGVMPPGILRRKNGINHDDRIDNLEVIKKKFNMSYVNENKKVTELGFLPKDFGPGIYEILCKGNGRRYVGSAVSVHKRWNEHHRQLLEGKHHSIHLQRAWNKYGEDGFVFSVIERCEQDNLIDREQHYIDSIKPEFNCVAKAGSQLGYRHTEETRKKMSASRDRSFSPMKGRKHSQETIEKIRKTKTGVKFGKYSDERIEKAAARSRESISAMSPDEVRKIRALKILGLTHGEVAKSIGRSYWAVSDAASGRTYGWVK